MEGDGSGARPGGSGETAMNVAPMEALAATSVPEGPEWQYEPKWDGFRCLARREQDAIEMQSKSGQPLARYFPDVAQALQELRARRFLLDGELVIPVDGQLSFNDLQLRLHPAASRVNKLAREHPALYLVFDLLEDERGTSWLDRPLRERREPRSIRREVLRRRGSDSAVAGNTRPESRAPVAADDGRRARRDHRQEYRGAVRGRPAYGLNAEDQGPAHGRLRGRRIPLCGQGAGSGVAAAGPV